eukprot:TRINITY_DN10583_c0_g1_i3.p1 TRINITY_DN10583_c0_g1~~TRINITY_DN10583_c0_g1_i3.p1  ORF type:complete len:190 (+),score=45.99 TRINITY_DN10583_c0_g1_i3:257-826(+)
MPEDLSLDSAILYGFTANHILVTGTDEDRNGFVKGGGLDAATRIIQADGEATETNAAVDVLCQLTRTPAICQQMRVRELPLVAGLLQRLVECAEPDEALLVSCARLLGNCVQAELVSGQGWGVSELAAQPDVIQCCEKLLEERQYVGVGGATVAVHSLRILHAVASSHPELVASLSAIVPPELLSLIHI